MNSINNRKKYYKMYLKNIKIQHQWMVMIIFSIIEKII